MLITRRLGHEPKLAAEDALRQLSTLDWTRPGAGVLAHYPVVRGNPFQALLYSQLATVGLSAVPTYDVDTTASLAEAMRGTGLDLAVHVHWLNVVLAKAEDERDAKDKLAAYLEKLSRVVDLGGRVLWTVHNILPHETRWPELEAELRRGVVELAERVHVMSPRTRELVAPWFDIPAEKLLTVPHPTYQGVYPSWMSRAQARAELGISPDTCVLLLIGRVQPYKGLTELLEAYEEVTTRAPGRYTLLVAGPPNQEPETQEFVERLRVHPTAYAALRKLPDEEMQLYLRAADVAVFPYRRSLNSGALALALTFGLPAILPADSGEGTRLSPTCVHTYDRADPTGLRDALAAAPRIATPQARQAAYAAAARLSPERVGGAFAASLRGWLDTPPGRSTPVSQADLAGAIHQANPAGQVDRTAHCDQLAEPMPDPSDQRAVL